jgi:hypothetical protein
VQAFQDALGGNVVGMDIGLDAVQFQCAEAMADQRRQRLLHVALAPVRPRQHVADLAAVVAAVEVVQGDGADQLPSGRTMASRRAAAVAVGLEGLLDIVDGLGDVQPRRAAPAQRFRIGEQAEQGLGIIGATKRSFRRG